MPSLARRRRRTGKGNSKGAEFLLDELLPALLVIVPPGDKIWLIERPRPPTTVPPTGGVGGVEEVKQSRLESSTTIIPF